MSVTYRRIRAGDAAGVARVHCESWRTTYPGLIPAHVIAAFADEDKRRAGWQEIIDRRPGAVWVAESAGEIVGFADGGPARTPNDGCDGQLYGLYLLQAAQRRGIGGALMRHVHSDLRAAGYTSARVEVLKGNAPAIAFYEASGAVMLREASFRMMGEDLVELVYAWQPLPD